MTTICPDSFYLHATVDADGIRRLVPDYLATMQQLLDAEYVEPYVRVSLVQKRIEQILDDTDDGTSADIVPLIRGLWAELARV